MLFEKMAGPVLATFPSSAARVTAPSWEQTPALDAGGLRLCSLGMDRQHVSGAVGCLHVNTLEQPCG